MSLTSALGDFSVTLPTQEASIFSVLATAIPPEVRQSITDPAFVSSIQSDFRAGNTPSWYSDLPADVKSYISDAGSYASGVDLSSIASEATSLASSIGSAASNVASAASRVSGAAASATNNGAGPAPTGAVLASMAGVAGVLALAIGL